MIVEKDEPILREEFLRSRLVVEIPVSDMAARCDGKLLLSGILVVPHSEEEDRFTFGRRRPNRGEVRVAWATLPHGPRLIRVWLKKDESIRKVYPVS